MTDTNEVLTILLSNAHGHGEVVEAQEVNRGGLYGVGTPGRQGLSTIVIHPGRNVSARLDIFPDGSWKVFPYKRDNRPVLRGELAQHRAFWKSILR